MKTDLLASRHIGINEQDTAIMLRKIGVNSLDELINQTIPANIRLKEPLALTSPLTEYEFGKHIAELAAKNKLYTTYIGLGWYNTITPAVIQRNVFENPVWYTSYTPYQTEVSQGRLEALMNFQTAVCDLTAMPLANCSLLDEATAAAEAVSMMYALRSRAQQKANANVVFVDENIFPQTLAVMTTRAVPQGIELRVGKYKDFEPSPEVFACILQYPNSHGNVEDYSEFTEKAHAADCKVAVAADILSLALLTPPGEWGADIVFGTTQRLGTPMFYGGPSAAFFATKDEYKRNMPGRIIGWSKDKYGKLCYRMALQTREQHIKREKATSNICTAQALLATMAGFYAVYHGQEGITTIASRIHSITVFLEKQLKKCGYTQVNAQYFDTLRFELPEHVSAQQIRTIALTKEVNLRYYEMVMSVSALTKQQTWQLPMCCSRFCHCRRKRLSESGRYSGKKQYRQGFETYNAFPDTRSIQQVSHGNRDDALHQTSEPQRYFSCTIYDFPRFMYNEAECSCGNVAFKPSRVYGYAPAGPGRPSRRLS